MNVLALLPADPPPDKVTPGFAGFLAVFAIAIATVLLIRSMVGHLRKVRYSTPPSEDASSPGEALHPGEPRPGDASATDPAAGPDPAPDPSAAKSADGPRTI